MWLLVHMFRTTRLSAQASVWNKAEAAEGETHKVSVRFHDVFMLFCAFFLNINDEIGAVLCCFILFYNKNDEFGRRIPLRLRRRWRRK